MNVLSDYSSTLKGKALSPREYIEEQLTMTEEDQSRKMRFMEELFATAKPSNAEALVVTA